jgi:hypothetical protein
MNQNFEIRGNFLLDLLKPFPGLFFYLKIFKKRTRSNSKKACETQTWWVSKKTKTCPTLVATY